MRPISPTCSATRCSRSRFSSRSSLSKRAFSVAHSLRREVRYEFNPGVLANEAGTTRPQPVPSIWLSFFGGGSRNGEFRWGCCAVGYRRLQPWFQSLLRNRSAIVAKEADLRALAGGVRAPCSRGGDYLAKLNEPFGISAMLKVLMTHTSTVRGAWRN
jgi:hypothetical protein